MTRSTTLSIKSAGIDTTENDLIGFHAWAARGELTTSPPPNHTDVTSQCSWVDFMPPPLKTTEETCGDTCALVDTMASTFAEYVPPKIRMERAVAAVRTGKLNQSVAATKFEVTQQGISKALKRTTTGCSSETSQSPQGVSQGQREASSRPGKLTKDQIRGKLRQMCNEQDERAPDGFKLSNPKMRGWLIWKGATLPENLQGQTTPYPPSDTCDQSSSQLSSSSSHGRFSKADQNDSNDEFDESIGDQINRVCQEVQQSDRPSDFKRAILLLRELTEICTKAWYGAFDGEEWNHHDWAHVNSDIKTIQSLVSQRAQETSDELLHGSTAN